MCPELLWWDNGSVLQSFGKQNLDRALLWQRCPFSCWTGQLAIRVGGPWLAGPQFAFIDQ